MISPLKFLSLALATATAVNAAMTAREIVDSINVITKKSKALQAPANSINIVNGALIVIGQGPFSQIITGFGDIASTVTGDISGLQGTEPFKLKKVEQDIVNAFKDFVKVHQDLLNILIGKAGLFSDVPLIGSPVAAVLRQLENVVDTIAYLLIDLIPDEISAATGQKDSLDATIKLTIDAYDGLSIIKKRSYPVAFQG